MEKKYEHGFVEAKTSGGAVYELGVKTSKHSKAVRRLAEPLMAKHWKDSVTNLHRIYKVAEYLLKRSKRKKMTEFTNGIFKVVSRTSLGRALIYTLGHIVIAMSVVSVLTGASLWQAGAVALVEPTINGIWYYFLDKLFTMGNK